MSNVRTVPGDDPTQALHTPDTADTADTPADRARLRRLAVLFDEVTHRIAALRARGRDEGPDEAARLAAELAALEDDWRCLASARACAGAPWLQPLG